MSKNNNTQGRRPKVEVNPNWSELQQLVGQTVNVNVTAENKSNDGRSCGLNIEHLGIAGFLPGSELPRTFDRAAAVGQTISVKVLEADPHKKGGRFLVSRKAVVVEEQRAYIGALVKGESEVEGKVVSIAQLKQGKGENASECTGYFVAIGNEGAQVEALLHEMQIPRKNGQVLTFQVGDTVKARVIGANVESGHVTLSMRPKRDERSDNRRGGRHNDQRKGRGNAPAQRDSQRSGSNGTDRTNTAPPATKTVTTPRPQPQPKPKRVSAPTPLRKGRKDGLTQSFSSFADLGAWFAQQQGGTPAAEPTTTATETAAQPAPSGDTTA